MQRYVCLLRGINVSGKNKISMADLRNQFIYLGFDDVKTYLNSGNIIFSSDGDKQLLTEKIRLMINDAFDLDIPVLIILQDDVKELLNNEPSWLQNEDKERYDNIIFLMSSLSYQDFIFEIGDLNKEYETAFLYNGCIFWSFSRKDYQKTNWWSKTASFSLKDMITIRTLNTIRKIAFM